MSKNITREERIKIKALLDQGYKAPYIADYLGRNTTSIYREVSKTDSSSVYDDEYANNITSFNMARHRHRSPSLEIIEVIEKKILDEQWPPEQISGWLLVNYEVSVSHTWIYSHIEKIKVLAVNCIITCVGEI